MWHVNCKLSLWISVSVPSPSLRLLPRPHDLNAKSPRRGRDPSGTPPSQAASTGGAPDADETDRLLRLLIDSVRDYAIFLLDPTGHVLTWNPGAQRLKGYTPSEIVGRHFSTFYPPEDIIAVNTERELREADEE